MKKKRKRHKLYYNFIPGNERKTSGDFIFITDSLTSAADQNSVVRDTVIASPENITLYTIHNEKCWF